jgi:hypothetical protein
MVGVHFRNYITWNKDKISNTFFKLSEIKNSGILNVLPSTHSDKKETNDKKYDKYKILFDSLKDKKPDVNQMKRVIEELPSTEQSLDVLATIVSIMTFRNSIRNLKSLIDTQKNSNHPESKYKDILSENPWMLGSHYTEVIEKEFSIWFNARVDLMLESALGHIDIVELKRPDTSILVENKKAKTWRQSSELSDAIAQSQKYIRLIDENALKIESELRLLQNQSISRMYRSKVIIVAGRTPWQKLAIDALRDINLSNNRMLILTYDDILAIAQSTLNMFEKNLKHKQVCLR